MYDYIKLICSKYYIDNISYKNHIIILKWYFCSVITWAISSQDMQEKLIKLNSFPEDILQ